MSTKQIHAFAAVTHREYALALENANLDGLVRASHDLSSAYAMMGNTVLAMKWADEYLVNLCRAHAHKPG